MNDIKARMVRVKTLSAASAVLLDAAVNGWLGIAAEKTLLDAQFMLDGGTYAVILFYTEG